MDKIKHIKVIDCKESLYIKPARLQYEQDGKQKIWDLVRVHDSVVIVIYNITRQVLLFVKQFRPAVYFADVKPGAEEKEIDVEKYPPKLGITLELCAGIVDKDQSLAASARDEILEECGYDVPLSLVTKVTSYRSGVGESGSRQTLFYAEVTDSMKVTEGGGCPDEGEYIEVVEKTLSEAKALIYDESVPRPQSLLLALLWFFANKAPPQENPQL